MKLSYIKILITLILFTNFSIGQVTLGGGAAYGSEINEPGINIRAGALLSNVVHFGADLNYFLPGDDGLADVDVYDLNANLSFRLNAGELLYLYPLVGLNYTSIRTRLGDITTSSTEVGANVGGGLGINIGAISPFIQYKYVLSDYDQSVINIGVILNVGSTDR